MTQFLHIDPKARTVKIVEAKEWQDVSPNLKRTEVDFGTVMPGVSIIVYEYGLLEGSGPYFALMGQLYSGDAVLYGYDEAGETIDMPDIPQLFAPEWLADKIEVELAIMAGIVERPVSTVNGAVFWQWS